MAADDDQRFMRRALELAVAGWGRVHPNPLVGAVVVRDGEVVGEGYHTAFGAPHAEVEALRAAGERARGATVYVTLEPCDHHGKTPPCTEALLAAGVARVVFAAEDPGAAGGGGERLRAAGVDVTVGVERAAARRQNAAFFHALERPGCYLALKYGMSLDGRLAPRVGERATVTGPESHAQVHRLRAGFDAIMVGGETARIDDPLLTVRGDVTPIRPPMRVVLDPDGELDPGSRLARTAGDAPVVVVAAEGAARAHIGKGRRLEDAGVRLLEVRRSGDGLDLAAAMARLRAEGVRSVLCEGGGRLGAALLAAGLVRRLYLFVAPVLYGGGAPAFPSVGRHIAGVTVDVKRYGDDVLVAVDLDEPEPDGGAEGREATAGIG